MAPYAPPGDSSRSGAAAPPASDGPRRKKRKARPREGYAAHLDGDVLVVSHGAAIPRVCIKCGSHQEVAHRLARFQWSPRWARLLVFCIVGIFIRLLVTRRAELLVPLCPPCNKRWVAGRYALVAGIVGLVGAMVALRLGTEGDPSTSLPGLAVVIGAFVVLARGYVRPRMLEARKIDDDTLELTGCHPDAAQEIAEGSRPRA